MKQRRIDVDDTYENAEKRRKYRYKSKFCWVCGKTMKDINILDKDKGTMHHLIPKCLNPHSNVIVPICLDCHKKIHGLIKYDDDKK
jgi:5-methylcytosine-specific restriction endonuclease McrA